MREILFRGKRTIDGEWCEGNLFIDEKGDKHEILLGYTNYRIAWEVIPETVGQYTGLTDKNGTKIFKGDIVRKVVNGEVLIGVVEYSDAAFGVRFADRSGQFLCFFVDGCEVIGNICDNPELISNVC